MDIKRFEIGIAGSQNYKALKSFYNVWGEDLLRSGLFEELDDLGLSRLFDLKMTRIVAVHDRESGGMAGSAILGVIQTLRPGWGEVNYVLTHPDYRKTEDRRGYGIGRAMMDFLHREARALRLVKIRLISEPHRTSARSMYESMGYRLSGGSDRHYEVKVADLVIPD
ncbi:MAG: GNAT family N-acetyltransferase [Candidatus Uhrbacteria bacterium]|nr:GNAT family N-acetyltransferase [Candidatus Uhrbacteria bacterium]